MACLATYRDEIRVYVELRTDPDFNAVMPMWLLLELEEALGIDHSEVP